MELSDAAALLVDEDLHRQRSPAVVLQLHIRRQPHPYAVLRNQQ
ncbi:hypothetical protein A176_001075 [Myxococcus hansupus]|uniref:Uncharacterized protein n=1 Tax=Pseudomyxococcus hansupus TaxID=1297742 RepID=A0A0H4WRF3_9BACT|nr:hypothetical protein A176_001075 [Myxococcus hansupus]